MKYFIKNNKTILRIKIELPVLGIYNFHGFFLFIALFSYKNSNNLFCYTVTCIQYPILLKVFKNVISSSHLHIVHFMNRLSWRILLFCYMPSYIFHTQYTCDITLW